MKVADVLWGCYIVLCCVIVGSCGYVVHGCVIMRYCSYIVCHCVIRGRCKCAHCCLTCGICAIV